MNKDKFIGLNGMNYEMLYSQDVIERMHDYNEADYCSDDCLAFIDKYGEADFLQYYDDYEIVFNNKNQNFLVFGKE
jgi:hypothetical protein